MHHSLMTFVLIGLLAGCAQPQSDEAPRASGSYLMVENGDASIVLFSDGQRVEEKGRVLDVVRFDSPHTVYSASYVVQTEHCGRLQWLARRTGAAEAPRSVPEPTALSTGTAGCRIGSWEGREWTTLDYST